MRAVARRLAVDLGVALGLAHAWHVSVLAVRACLSRRGLREESVDEAVRTIGGQVRVSPGEYERLLGRDR